MLTYRYLAHKTYSGYAAKCPNSIHCLHAEVCTGPCCFITKDYGDLFDDEEWEDSQYLDPSEMAVVRQQLDFLVTFFDGSYVKIDKRLKEPLGPSNIKDIHLNLKRKCRRKFAKRIEALFVSVGRLYVRGEAIKLNRNVNEYAKVGATAALSSGVKPRYKRKEGTCNRKELCSAQ